jgi:hypothetical protein
VNGCDDASTWGEAMRRGPADAASGSDAVLEEAVLPIPSPPPQADTSSASAHATQAHHILFMPASLTAKPRPF